MEKITRKSFCILLIIIFTFSMSACRGSFHLHKHNVWESEDSSIKIDLYSDVVSFRINGALYEFYDIATDNTGTEMYIYQEGGLTDDDILIIAEAEEKKGRLYLTFTQDKLFDLEGQTVVLDPVLSED